MPGNNTAQIHPIPLTCKETFFRIEKGQRGTLPELLQQEYYPVVSRLFLSTKMIIG